MKQTARIAGSMLALALTVAACGGDDDDDGAADVGDFAGETVEVAAIWTGGEQERFTAVLDACAAASGATVNYTPTGDNVSTFLGTRIEGGAPPDVAILPQQGVLVQFAEAGDLIPLADNVTGAVDDNFAGIWADLGSSDGTQYGVYFKAANKSTVWYRPEALENAGVDIPETWDDFVAAAQTIADSGVTPVSVGGADGWTLTDWFENVYVSQAGADMYDQLAAHEIPWTDQSVVTALETLAQLWGNPNLIATGALQTDFPTSVINVFADDPSAAIVYEGDFAATTIDTDTNTVVGEGANFFAFPRAGDDAGVVGGGDVAVAMTDRPVTMELLEYLASAEAGEIWAARGGFTSPNTNVDLDVYPDDVSRASADQLVAAGDNFRFDLSDLAPAEFGGGTSATMWVELQDFLGNPTDAQGTAAALEAGAAAAYGG